MLTEEFILGLVLCTALFILSWFGRSMPLRVVSSLGLVYLALDWVARTEDLFGMAIMFAIAFGMVLVRRE